ncbi:hypothetical protein [Plantactinospora sp. CA-290183]|uniref:hypothetical protein n=1 Tax=Plantactinospora sp. CA-290183 TaxID=3240006 RepID=UPI003D8DEFB6
MNLDEVKATIRSGNDSAEHGKRTLQEAAEQAAAAEQLAQLTIHSSQDEDARAGLAILESLGREVELTMRRFDAATAQADAYIAALG